MLKVLSTLLACTAISACAETMQSLEQMPPDVSLSGTGDYQNVASCMAFALDRQGEEYGGGARVLEDHRNNRTVIVVENTAENVVYTEVIGGPDRGINVNLTLGIRYTLNRTALHDATSAAGACLTEERVASSL